MKKTKTITNLGATIRAKLYNIARKTGRDFDSLLLQYFAEAVEHLEQFIEPTCSKRLSSKHDAIWKPEVWKWQ